MSQMPKIADEQGFTLLELLVIIALLALLSTVAIIWLPNIRDRMIVEQATDAIERELIKASIESAKTGKDLFLVIEKHNDSYQMQKNKIRMDLGKKIDIQWVAAEEAGTNSRQSKIVFLGTGGASGGHMTISKGSFHHSLHVDWLTGHIRRQ